MLARFAVLMSMLIIFAGCRRSVHRPETACLPELKVSWSDDSRTYFIKNSHLEPHIFETYDEAYLNSRRLPETVRSRYNPETVIRTQDMIDQLEDAVETLTSTHKKTKALENFIILKQRDYNYRKQTGLIVLKFKNYPFVVKLFMEKPDTLVKPFNKGVEECAFFVMGGGINRFLAGFTRIKNCEIIRCKINSNRYWKEIIDLPRKWYWTPRNNRSLKLESWNIGTGHYCVIMPHMYAIICDAIEAERTFSLYSRSDRQTAIAATEFLGLRIDPHINNFMVEQGTKKILLIDTEHFPTMVGIKDEFVINDYLTYYTRLVCKFFRDKLTYHKESRSKLQTNPQPHLFPLRLDGKN